MKEIEILVQVFASKKTVLKSLKRFEFKGIKKTKDVYFFDPLRDSLKVKDKIFPKEWFRVRRKDNKAYITYKVDVFNKDKWTHSNEYEMEVGDFSIANQIVKRLGLKELIVVDNMKHTYETKDYEIVFEEVKGLGLFLEVEKLNVKCNANVKKIKKKIQWFIDRLGFKVSPDVNIGKPELMLKSRITK